MPVLYRVAGMGIFAGGRGVGQRRWRGRCDSHSADAAGRVKMFAWRGVLGGRRGGAAQAWGRGAVACGWTCTQGAAAGMLSTYGRTGPFLQNSKVDCQIYDNRRSWPGAAGRVTGHAHGTSRELPCWSDYDSRLRQGRREQGRPGHLRSHRKAWYFVRSGSCQQLVVVQGWHERVVRRMN